MDYLKLDPNRVHAPETGIPFRAKNDDGEYRPIDLAWLTGESIVALAKDRGLPFMTAIVLALLGHEDRQRLMNSETWED